MAIELSTLTFTNNDDIVPEFGIDELVNTGTANTLAGNDQITGTATLSEINGEAKGITNSGTLITGSGNDSIRGIGTSTNPSPGDGNSVEGIDNRGGTIGLENGDDSVIGTASGGYSNTGIFTTADGAIDGGNGDDKIIGLATGALNANTGTYLNAGAVIDGGNGNDLITGTGVGTNGSDAEGIRISNSFVRGGNGNDFIVGTATGNGPAGISISGEGGGIDAGSGDDLITGTAIDTFTATGFTVGIYSDGTINTGDGSDIITGTASGSATTRGIVNTSSGTINTGDGNDIITGSGVIGVYNDGIINTGKGNDIIDAFDGGFETVAGTGVANLENGNDLVRGFGRGSFDGGGGRDTLELTSGSYTVGISGTTVSFTKDGITMNTSAFENLVAGSTTYDFTNLTNGQAIAVA